MIQKSGFLKLQLLRVALFVRKLSKILKFTSLSMKQRIILKTELNTLCIFFSLFSLSLFLSIFIESFQSYKSAQFPPEKSEDFFIEKRRFESFEMTQDDLALHRK